MTQTYVHAYKWDRWKSKRQTATSGQCAVRLLSVSGLINAFSRNYLLLVFFVFFCLFCNTVAHNLLFVHIVAFEYCQQCGRIFRKLKFDQLEIYMHKILRFIRRRQAGWTSASQAKVRVACSEGVSKVHEPPVAAVKCNARLSQLERNRYNLASRPA